MTVIKDFHNQIVGLVALVVLVAGFVLAPEERVDKLGHALVAFGSTSAGQVIYAALTALVVAAFRWALARIPSTDSRPQRIPPGSGALLLALAIGASVSACGSLSPTQRTDLATETQRCLIAERFIVDRVGTTAEEDAAALAAERARCDAARAAIVGGAQ